MKEIKLAVLGSLLIAAPCFARDIAVADLPKPVVNALKTAHPDMKLIKAEEDHDHGFHYEVKIELKDRSRREIDIKPDGTILKTEHSD